MEEKIKGKIPSFSNTRWIYSIRIVSFIKENYSKIIKTFQTFQNISSLTRKKKSTVNYILNELEDGLMKSETAFLYEIFSIISTLNNIFQSKKQTCPIFKLFLVEAEELFNSLQERNCQNEKRKNLINQIIEEINTRFDSFKSLRFIEVFSIPYENLKICYIAQCLNSLDLLYPELFDTNNLKTELFSISKYFGASGVQLAQIAFDTIKKNVFNQKLTLI